MPSPEFHDIHSREIRVVVKVPGENAIYSADRQSVVLFSDPPRLASETGLERLTMEKRALGVASRHDLPSLSMDRSLGQTDNISGFVTRPSSGTGRINVDTLPIQKFTLDEILDQARFDEMFAPILPEGERLISRVDLYFILRALRHEGPL